MERALFECTRAASQALRNTPRHASKAAARTFTSTCTCTSTTTITPPPSLRCTSLRPVPTQHRPSHHQQQTRTLHTTPSRPRQSPSASANSSSNEQAQAQATDFASLDVLRNTVAPATSIDACTPEGFALNNNVRLSGCGVLLVGGEAFRWQPWADPGPEKRLAGRLLNAKGQWDVGVEGWGVLEVCWPKPDLLIIGTGPTTVPIAPATRKYLNGLGIRLDVQDTRNAAAQFNLLATERGVQQVAAALVPIGWRELPKA